MSVELGSALRQLEQTLEQVSAGVEPGVPAGELFRVLTAAERTSRVLDRIAVTALGILERDGEFSALGYRSTTTAVTDLTGCERAEAHRRVRAAGRVCDRIGLDAAVLPPTYPATADVFTAGRCALAHVEVIGRTLESDEAGRLAPQVWAEVEQDLAEKATRYSAEELRGYATELIRLLDQDGPEPGDESRPINRLRLQKLADRPGGKLTGHFEDPALWSAIATAIDAGSKPLPDDDRDTETRQAEALADICGFVLDHGDSTVLPECGGRRPHITVTTSLEELETRARTAMLEFGGYLSTTDLRLLCCDAGVVPVVMNGSGQPLDVGRLRRTWTDAQRRAITARDRGCARCGRPPSRCEIHHVIAWEHGGETTVDNGVMLCKACHRIVHHAGWTVHIRDGHPEFIPPRWIDISQTPRRRPKPAPRDTGPPPPATPIPTPDPWAA